MDDCEVKDRKVGQAVAGERLSQCDRVQLMLLSAAGLTAVSALLAQQLHHWQVCMRHQALEVRVAKIALLQRPYPAFDHAAYTKSQRLLAKPRSQASCPQSWLICRRHATYWATKQTLAGLCRMQSNA